MKGELLCKEKGISRAWQSGLRKVVRAEDTGHVSKLCVKTLLTSANFLNFIAFFVLLGIALS